MNGNLIRMSQTPGRRVIPALDANLAVPQNNNNEDDQQPPRLVASLSRLPRTLHDLWHEWEFGFAGKKAAKDFTPAERGKVKHSFYKRKFFWRKCNEMVNSGWSAQRACDKIYEVYGPNRSVTYILDRLKRDHLADPRGHPQLRNLHV